MPTVFLSHNSQDRNFVERLASDLRANGVDVWYDKWEIKVGDSIVSKINDAISSRDYLAVVLTPRSVASRWVQIELNAAVMRELAQRSVYLLPILAEPCQIPPLIADKRYADFTTDYYLGLADLLTVVFPEQSGAAFRSTRPIVDTNAHLWMQHFDSDLQDVLTRARLGGVQAIVAAGCSGVLSWAKCLDLARRYDFVYASLALHPYHGDTDLKELRRLADQPDVVALGDAHINYDLSDRYSRETQTAVFDAHLQYAEELHLPLIVEIRNFREEGNADAETDFWQALRAHRSISIPIAVQLPARPDFIQQCRREGFYFVVAGNITHPRAQTMRSSLTDIPLDRLLLASDAPMLAPHPMRGKRNEPAFIQYAVDVIANSMGHSADDVARITTDTANRVFKFESRDSKKKSTISLPNYFG